MALFNNESFEGWTDLYAINSASIFFVTTAFLGLLAKGSEDEENYWSSVVNTTSISGLIKVAQDHVSTPFPTDASENPKYFFGLVLLQQRESCRFASYQNVFNGTRSEGSAHSSQCNRTRSLCF